METNFKLSILSFLSSLNLILAVCPNIQLQTDPALNITEYIRHSWYVQYQQENGYQKKNSLYCVVATYNIDNNSHIPFSKKKVLSVYNYANYNKVNGDLLSGNKPLCARILNNSEPEKLYVSPCFLPNFFSGPYWIINAGPSPSNYEWAIVGGGNPSISMGNNTCAYKKEGFKNSGLWLFGRKPILEEEKISIMKNLLVSKNIDINQLLKVKQENCSYKNYFLK